MDLPDGKADTIMISLKNFFTTHQLDTNRLIGFGSVIVGRKTGVATQLEAINPEMLNVNCIAHRLALASAQASSNILYLKKFKDIMRQLFYFYQNSAVRMQGLKEIENILDDPVVKLKDICNTRWLSHLNSVEAVKCCHPSLIASLEREASERTDATAA
ncbi:zinc finger protein 862-like [Mytilus galloprovincialis]|uniref:zinc finger protein 862-like n=1 Tax=Mytilus galloprovincialis TaxID=29158 RepID=UPI003F7C8DD3